SRLARPPSERLRIPERERRQACERLEHVAVALVVRTRGTPADAEHAPDLVAPPHRRAGGVRERGMGRGRHWVGTAAVLRRDQRAPLPDREPGEAAIALEL